MKTKHWKRTDTNIIPDHVREEFRKQFDKMFSTAELSLNKEGKLTDLTGKLVDATPVGTPFTLEKQFAAWKSTYSVTEAIRQDIRSCNLMEGEEKPNAYRIVQLSKQVRGLLLDNYEATVQLYKVKGLKTFEERINEFNMFEDKENKK